jgi:hypothetical protein
MNITSREQQRAKRIWECLLISLFLALTAASLVPSYEVHNGSSSWVRVELNTVMNPHEKPFLLQSGGGNSGYRDDTEFLSLRVIYPSGKVITLDRRAIRQIKRTSKFRRGIWWIDDSGVRYISRRDANLRDHHRA